MTMVSLNLFSSIFLLCVTAASGFSTSSVCNRALSTRLNGIAEWRDFPSGITFDGDTQDEAYDILNYGPSARRVPVVVVKPEQAVLQGEKKYFQFHSNDELRLFQQTLDRNHGIFALGVLISEDEDSDDVIMSKLQLMEIKEHNMELGVDFGIFCTAQAVGKASLLSLLGEKPDSSINGNESTKHSPIAICEEHFDLQETYYSIEDANGMAREVLQLIKKLSEKEEKSRRKALGSGGHDVKIFHDINDVYKNKEDEEMEEHDEDEETRGDRFAHAYLEALDSDSHGYVYSTAESKKSLMTWKELNAISWAAFSSDLIPSTEATMRLHAFDQDRIIDRLKLASYWLADIVEEVEYGSNSR